MIAGTARAVNQRLGELGREGINDDQLDWAIEEIGRQIVKHELHARQGKDFKAAFIDEATQSTGATREALLICATAGQRKLLAGLKRGTVLTQREIDLMLRRHIIPDSPGMSFALIDSMPKDPSAEALELAMRHLSAAEVQLAMEDTREFRVVVMGRILALGTTPGVRTKQRAWAIIARYGASRIKRNGIAGHIEPRQVKNTKRDLTKV